MFIFFFDFKNFIYWGNNAIRTNSERYSNIFIIKLGTISKLARPNFNTR